MIKFIKHNRSFLFAGIFILFLSFANNASADMTLTPGEVQLSVAGILLNVEGSSGTLNQIAFNGSSFDVTINSSQNITFSSADRRQLSFSPTSASSYISRSCTSSKSSMTINGSGLSGPLTITITPETSLCTSSSGDSGGTIFGPGEGGGFANYNFGPTPDVLFPSPIHIPVPAPIPAPIPVIPSKATVPELPPSALQPSPNLTPTSPYEPAAPVYIPPQPELPAAKLPATATPATSPAGAFNFLLLYWPWIIAAFATVTLFGILLFVALRE